MKLLYQFGVILAVTFVGELLYALLPLPIPASIYGLIVMLICLGTKVVKLSQVKIAADFLIDIMPPMFIPAAVGLADSLEMDSLSPLRKVSLETKAGRSSGHGMDLTAGRNGVPALCPGVPTRQD